METIDPMLLIMIWFTAIVAGSLIGSGKGRFAEGLLLGLVLSWVGVIIVAFLSDPRKQEQEQLGMEQARLQIDIQRAQLDSLQKLQSPSNSIPPPPGAVPTLHVAKDGKNLGELPRQEVELMLADGRLALTDYYFNQATQQWSVLSDVFSANSLSWKCRCGLVHGSKLDNCPVCLRSRAATI